MNNNINNRLNNLRNNNENNNINEIVNVENNNNIINEISNNENNLLGNNNNIDNFAQASIGIARLGNQIGEVSEQMSENVAIIRENNASNDRTITLIRNDNNQLAVRLNDSNQIEINSITRGILVSGGIGILSFFGFRIINHWLDNYIVRSGITNMASALVPQVESRHTIVCLGLTIWDNTWLTIPKR